MARRKTPNNETKITRIAKAIWGVVAAAWANPIARWAIVTSYTVLISLVTWIGTSVFGYTELFSSVGANSADIAVIKEYIQEDREFKLVLQNQVENNQQNFDRLFNLLSSR